MSDDTHRRPNPPLQILSAILVAAPVFAFSWAWGGMRGDILRTISPLVSLVCAAGMLFLPQRHVGEGAGRACRRVWMRMLSDPFAWVALALVVYLLLPLFNVGLSPVVDATAITSGAEARPPCPFLPFCVSTTEHMGVVNWFVPILLSSLGVRHALTRAGKRGLFEALVWNGVALAVLGFVQMLTHAHFPFWGEVPHRTYFFSVFAYPNAGGAFFTLIYAFSVGLWFFRIDEVERSPLSIERMGRSFARPGLRAHYPALAVATLFCAVFATLCRAAMVLTLLLTGVFLLYVALRPFAETGMLRARRFRSLVTVGAIVLAMMGVVFVYAPPDIGRELKTLNAFTVSDRVTGKGQYHTRIATAIMREHPLFGVGGWGYRHFCVDQLRKEKGERLLQTVGGANVHNDYLQFLVEHGIVGFVLMVFCLYLLAKPVLDVWNRLIQIANVRARSGVGVASLAVFSVVPPVFWIFLGTVAVLLHAFGDCPLRAASVLSLVYVSQSVSMGFLPRLEDEWEV